MPKLGKNKRKKYFSGFSLIELMVAIFIFALVLASMVAIFVSTTGAHSKSKAIKIVAENAQFALNSIAKDVRVAHVSVTTPTNYATGARQDRVILNSNRGGVVCYKISADALYLARYTDAGCSANEQKMVDLSLNKMQFSANSGFFSCPSATDTTDPNYYVCPAGSAVENRRGWVEINLEIVQQSSGQEMETEPIRIQTIVSSRDYGW